MSRVIYEPSGRAKEYCDFACNLYRGCSHGCTYCYAPAILRKTGLTRDDFFDHPAVRPGVLRKLELDAPDYAGREVQLCFTCDPYQPLDEELGVTREAIRILKDNDVIVRVLTKGGRRAERDFDLLVPGVDWHGQTLTYNDADQSAEDETMAASPRDRLITLENAKKLGLRTWVSMEPVKAPAQVLELIEVSKDYVDVYKLGKWNHDERAEEIDWIKFTDEAVTLLEKHNKEYHLSQALIDMKNNAS